MATTEEIELQDIGPIHQLSIPLPPGGGVVTLRGRNDAGKSEALKAVDALVSGRGSIEKRDGSARGAIRLGDASLTVVKQQRRGGSELAAVSLDSRFDLADLVDPNIKDPEKADSYRIKALVQLAGVTPDVTLFHQLADDKSEFDAIVRPEVSEASDIVAMAGMVKRDFEAASRKASDQAENALGNALGHREAALGYDPTVEADANVLQTALLSAVKEQQRLESEVASAHKHNVAIEEARAALERARRDSTLPSVAEAEEADDAAMAHWQSTCKEVEAAETALRMAKERKAKAEADMDLAARTLVAAQQHNKTLTAWWATARLDGIIVPEEEARAAQSRVVQAQHAVEQGALQRDKALRQQKAEAADRQALEHRKRSEKLRDAAKATDEILSSLVSRCGTRLRVERGRLVTDHKRGTIPYSELSDGTRWKIAIDIGVESLNRIGVEKHKVLLIIPQVAWSELSPANRRLVHEHAVERGVHILTAIATDDEEVTAEAFA